jgi:hypothetical protein
MDRRADRGSTRLKKGDQLLYDQLDNALTKFIAEQHDLLGVGDPGTRDTLLRQLVDSVHRVKYPALIRTRDLSQHRKDPSDGMFDPLKAALLQFREGNIDEAYWLVFLFAHFGRHRKSGYLYARSVYGRFDQGGLWDWKSTSSDPAGFRKWLHDNQERLDALPPGFGNHRKYESLDAYSDNGTGATVETYVAWVEPPRSHQQIFDEAIAQAGGDGRKVFDALYKSMKKVRRFGRLARFDYLAMIGKLGFAAIEPGSAYMGSATGPGSGARLLLAGSPDAKISSRELDDLLIRVDTYLNVGKQALEDAVCNWQKSPAVFKPFRG